MTDTTAADSSTVNVLVDDPLPSIAERIGGLYERFVTPLWLVLLLIVISHSLAAAFAGSENPIGFYQRILMLDRIPAEYVNWMIAHHPPLTVNAGITISPGLLAVYSLAGVLLIALLVASFHYWLFLLETFTLFVLSLTIPFMAGLYSFIGYISKSLGVNPYEMIGLSIPLPDGGGFGTIIGVVLYGAALMLVLREKFRK